MKERILLQLVPIQERMNSGLTLEIVTAVTTRNLKRYLRITGVIRVLLM
jgi:hypothetical protein